MEVVRRVCLCVSLGYRSILLAPKLRFEFRPGAVPVVVAAQKALAAV